ncbi:hypothetical protein BZG36_02160, partial [Bifiguratus adelaidae]
KLYEKIIGDKHEDAMSKFGAVLGQGIIDAGGRNVTISLLSRTGHSNMTAIVGMALFTQFWYWYPMTHFLSLAFVPTAVIGLTKTLEIPKFEFVSNAKPSLFAYPPPVKPPTTTVVEKVATAVLSTTAKSKARAKKLEKEKESDTMDTDEKVAEESEKKEEEKMYEDKEDKEEKDDKHKKKKKEDNFQILENLQRVVPQQLKYITFKKDSRYMPIKQANVGGILLMKDTRPDEEQDLIVPSAHKSATSSSEGTSEEQEASPFEPFEYNFDD